MSFILTSCNQPGNEFKLRVHLSLYRFNLLRAFHRWPDSSVGKLSRWLTRDYKFELFSLDQLSIENWKILRKLCFCTLFLIYIQTCAWRFFVLIYIYIYIIYIDINIIAPLSLWFVKIIVFNRFWIFYVKIFEFYFR